MKQLPGPRLLVESPLNHRQNEPVVRAFGISQFHGFHESFEGTSRISSAIPGHPERVPEDCLLGRELHGFLGQLHGAPGIAKLEFGAGGEVPGHVIIGVGAIGLLRPDLVIVLERVLPVAEPRIERGSSIPGGLEFRCNLDRPGVARRALPGYAREPPVNLLDGTTGEGRRLARLPWIRLFASW